MWAWALWFGRSALVAPARWDDGSLAVVDALAYYLAACVQRAVPGAAWAVARTPGRDWVHENQPVLTGFTVPVELVTRVLALLPRVYHLRRPGQPNADQVDRPTPDDLRRVFDQIVASAT